MRLKMPREIFISAPQSDTVTSTNHKPLTGLSGMAGEANRSCGIPTNISEYIVLRMIPVTTNILKNR